MNMHLLMIPSFYPTQANPLNGIFFKEQALMLKDAGLQIGVLYPEITPFKEMHPKKFFKQHFQTTFEMEEGIPTFRLHGWNLFPGCLRGTMHLWIFAIRHLFKQYSQKYGPPDVIHAHSSLWAGVAAGKIAKNTQIPLVLTEHRDQFIQGNSFSQKWLHHAVCTALEHSQKNIVVSHALKKGVLRFIKPSVSKIEVMPNCVDNTYFQPMSQKPPLTPFIFLTVAHLVKSKNISCLLHAFQLLLKQKSEIKLHIVGDGPQKKQLTQLAEQLKISSHVHFLGEQNRVSIKECYANAHAFVLPSLYETFGVVFIEALAMGIPVIGTFCGGPEEIITTDVGLLVKKNDPQDLMDGMCTLMDTYPNYRPEYLRKAAIKRYGKKNHLNQLLSLYQLLRKAV